MVVVVLAKSWVQDASRRYADTSGRLSGQSPKVPLTPQEETKHACMSATASKLCSVKIGSLENTLAVITRFTIHYAVVEAHNRIIATSMSAVALRLMSFELFGIGFSIDLLRGYPSLKSYAQENINRYNRKDCAKSCSRWMSGARFLLTD